MKNQNSFRFPPAAWPIANSKTVLENKESQLGPRVILHVPHASTEIPIMDGYLVSDADLQAEISRLTDWFADELFCSPDNINVVFPCSRLFCDVERFEDDSLEPMSKFGMGVLYEKMDDGRELRKGNPQLRQVILENYYVKHHHYLAYHIYTELGIFGKSLILDCHSFPDTPLNRSLNTTTPRPDFNIGTDPYHTPPQYIEAATKFFSARGYSLGVDWPYSGSIVPMAYFQKDNRVQSIMLEVNRRLYLKAGTTEKSENFASIQALVQEFISHLKALHVESVRPLPPIKLLGDMRVVTKYDRIGQGFVIGLRSIKKKDS